MLLHIISAIFIIVNIVVIISICKRNKVKSEFDTDRIIKNLKKQFKEKL